MLHHINDLAAVAGDVVTDSGSFLFPAGASTASGSAVTIDAAALLNISNLQISLLDAGFSTLAAGGVGKSSTLFDQTLIAGSSYYFQVQGSAGITSKIHVDSIFWSR